MDRRLDIHWQPIQEEKIWISVSEMERAGLSGSRPEYARYSRYRAERQQRTRAADIYVPTRTFPTSGLDNYFAVISSRETLLLPHTPIAVTLSRLDPNQPEDWIRMLLYSEILISGANRRSSLAEAEQTLKEFAARFRIEEINHRDFIEALRASEQSMQIFDPWSWRRHENERDEDWDEIGGDATF